MKTKTEIGDNKYEKIDIDGECYKRETQTDPPFNDAFCQIERQNNTDDRNDDDDFNYGKIKKDSNFQNNIVSSFFRVAL